VNDFFGFTIQNIKEVMMKKIALFLSFLVLFLGSSSSVMASSYGLQHFYSAPWANSGNLVESYSGPDDASMKDFSSTFSFSGALDSVDIFYQFIYYRDSDLSGYRYSSGITWDNYPATGYVDYTKITPDDTILLGLFGNYELVAYSVTLTPGNPGDITVDANVGFHWDEYSNRNVGSDSQFIGEYYVYAQAHGAPVPEPTTMLLLGSGLIGLAGFKRKMIHRRQ
jgi:hypothetical protein